MDLSRIETTIKAKGWTVTATGDRYIYGQRDATENLAFWFNIIEDDRTEDTIYLWVVYVGGQVIVKGVDKYSFKSAFLALSAEFYLWIYELHKKLREETAELTQTIRDQIPGTATIKESGIIKGDT